MSTLLAIFCCFSLSIASSSSLEPKGCQPRDDSSPVPLLVADEESGLQMVLCEAGLQYLREEIGDDLLYITSVVGPARKGKSFLLNNLRNISQVQPDDMSSDAKKSKEKKKEEMDANGFSVGHTAEGHTKGFWLSRKNDESVLTTSAGDRVTALFMDTEGSGAAGNFKSYDPKICAIAAIFSSNLMYNVMSEVSMDNLDFLAKITMFDSYLSKKKGASFPSPPLTWTVQSWEFSLEDYDPPDAMGYLHSFLRKKEISSELNSKERSEEKRQYEEYNELITAITSKFSPFDDASSSLSTRALPPILLFDKPSLKTKKKDLTQLSFSDYDINYQNQVKGLRDYIRQGAAPKEFSRGRPLTGKSFAQNIKILTDNLNQLTHVGDALLKAVGKEVAEQSLKEFKESSSKVSQPSPSLLYFEDQLAEIEKDILLRFQSGCLGNEADAINNEIKQQLMKDIESERRILQELNFNNQFDRCSRQASQHVDVLKNISSDSLFNSCGSKALVHVNDIEIVAVRDDHANTTESEADSAKDFSKRLLKLQKCFDAVNAHYMKLCSPSWCDSKGQNSPGICHQRLQRSLGDHSKRTGSAFQEGKNGLAQEGFESLFLYLLLIFALLFLPSLVFKPVAHIKSVIFYCILSLVFMSFYQGKKWLHVSICNFIFSGGRVLDPKVCMEYSNDLILIIGASFNNFTVLLNYIMDFFFDGGRHILEDEEMAWMFDVNDASPTTALEQLVYKIFGVLAAVLLTILFLRCYRK